MNFILDNNLYDINYLYIMEPVSNNVIENGTFYRIMYSNSHMTLNSLIFEIKLYNVNVIKIFNKYKISYNNDTNKTENFHTIKEVENNILNKFSLEKTPKKCIMESVDSDNIKLYSDKELDNYYDNISIYLKISGFWLNDEEYGLTYKFLC